jgi:hypothetical protein
LLIPNFDGVPLVVHSDIYRRASVVHFRDLVNDQIPTLTITLDRAIALAYALAYHEEISPDDGALARCTAVAAFGHTLAEMEGLLAAGYSTLFPSLAPAVSVE